MAVVTMDEQVPTGQAPRNIPVVPKYSLLSHAVGGVQEHVGVTCQK